MPAEELRRRIPKQLKIGPVETIKDLVNNALPGVTVAPMPTAPRPIPFHAGSVYLELDQRPALEQDEELGRDRYASGWRVSWSRTGVLGDSQRIGTLYVGHWRSIQTTRRRDGRSATSGCGQTSAEGPVEPSTRRPTCRPTRCCLHFAMRSRAASTRSLRRRRRCSFCRDNFVAWQLRPMSPHCDGMRSMRSAIRSERSSGPGV